MHIEHRLAWCLAHGGVQKCLWNSTELHSDTPRAHSPHLLPRMSENRIFKSLYEFIFPKNFFRRNLREGRHLCLMSLQHIALPGSTHLSGSSGNRDPECLSGFTRDWELPALSCASSNHLSSQFIQYIFVTEPSPKIQVCVPNALVSQNTETQVLWARKRFVPFGQSERTGEQISQNRPLPAWQRNGTFAIYTYIMRTRGAWLKNQDSVKYCASVTLSF